MRMTIRVAKTMTMAMTMAMTIKEIIWLTIHNQISRHTSKGPNKKFASAKNSGIKKAELNALQKRIKF